MIYVIAQTKSSSSICSEMRAWKIHWANLRVVLTLIKMEIKVSFDKLAPMRTGGGTYVAHDTKSAHIRRWDC